jgi:hypothetical protein
MTSQIVSSTGSRFLEQQIERKLSTSASQAQTPQGNRQNFALLLYHY